MKTTLIALVFLFSSALLYSQTPITNFSSDGSTYRYLLKEVNDTKYIVAFTKFDSIEVYKLNGEELELLHTNYYPCISLNFAYQEADHFLFFSNLERASIYNFIDNSFFELPSELSLVDNDWHNAKNGQAFLNKSTDINSEKKYLLVDYKENEFQELFIPESPIDHTEDFIIYNESVNNELNYFTLNIQTQDISLIANNVKNVYLENDNLYYLNDDGLFEYNFSSKETKDIVDYVGHVDTPKIVANNEYFFIHYHTGLSYSRVIIINRETNNSEDFLILREIDDLYPRILDNQLLFVGSDSLTILDLATQDFLSYRCGADSFDDIIFINDEKILFPNRYKYRILSLNDMTEAELDINYSSSGVLKLSSFKDEGKMYLNTDFGFVDSELFYLIDLEKNTSQYADLGFNDSIGLTRNSRIFNVGEQVILSYEDLYQIENGVLNKLNSNPLYRTGFKSFIESEESLFWTQRDSNGIAIYRFEDNQKTLNTLIPYNTSDPLDTEIRNYIILGNKTYYFENDYDSKLKCYNSSTNEFTEFEEIDVRNVGSSFFVNQDHLYFFKDTLRVLNPSGELSNLKFETEAILRGSVIDFKDNFYFIENTILYHIQGEKVSTIFDFTDASLFGHDVFGDYIRFNVFDEDFVLKQLIFDGISVEPLPLSSDQFFSHINDNYFYIKEQNGTVKTIVDIEGMQEFELPDSIGSKNLHQIFQHNNDYIFITGDVVHNKQKFSAYKTNRQYSQFEKLHSFNFEHTVLEKQYMPLSKSGLLYFYKSLFWINENLEFVKFDNILGDEDYTNIIRDNDYAYFIALDPILGRQVFSLPLNYGDISDNVENELFVQNVEVFPNPANQNLTIKSDLIKSTFNFQIYSTLGILIYKGISVNMEINISTLEQGQYVLVVRDSNGQIHTSQFVKANK